ncbi:MAG: TetR/AcrR family transcriptional regulator [Phenylobacterium sp.]|uniref:TetR/AcrR family transcriptional regulator n=1 Tax=Phenylobacterium sp. TaxID=1871053 RepID=UPI00273426ED|nr:TetR/AcrR family transcriptional regulator [Phenylobacterium sp.]MDP3748788.1 TetR/AcrR family transcriptional regulator [Phenylobacterium sp.]
MMSIIIGSRRCQEVEAMRIGREKVRENRERVVTAASELFRTHGFEGVAVPELMKAAGLTHGGFYNHFASKEALAREALESAWAAMAQERGRARDLPQLLRGYLSEAARNAPGKACPAAALAGDVRRQSPSVRATFAEGLDSMIDSIEAALGDDGRRAQAVGLVARMVGAVMLSRAVPDDHPLATELLEANLKAALEELPDGPVGRN